MKQKKIKIEHICCGRGAECWQTDLSWDEGNFAFQRGCPFALLSSNMFTAFLSAGPQTNCYCLCSAAEHLEGKYEESENVSPLPNLSSQPCAKIPWKHIKSFYSGRFTPGLLKRPRLCCVRAHRFIRKQRLTHLSAL